MKAGNPPPEQRPNIFKDIENWRSAYAKLVQNKAEKDTEHEKNIIETINLFEQFCKDYIDSFYDKSIKPEEASFPAKWLESTIEKVLLGYWEPILRAAEQYQVGHYKELLDLGYAKLENSKMGRQKIGLDKPIVLYFEKTGVYKRYPFGNIHLIGIPLLDAYRGDWNAMWHELGHYLYWNSKVNFENQSYYQGRGPSYFEQAINESVDGLKAREPEKERMRRILALWTEEIFADVIGTRIAGSEFVNAAWEKVLHEAETQNDLFKTDGKHPILYFLPMIRSFVAGEQSMIPQTTWEQRFGRLSFTTLRDSKNNDYLFRIENLLSVLKIYITKIDQKLATAKFESWFSGSSALEDLVAFILKDHPDYSPLEIARALLKPQLVERGADWVCGNCGTANSSADISSIFGVGIVGKCKECGSLTWFPSYKAA